MTSEPDLVVLLYRADWTRLSLSAEVHRVSTRALRGVPWGHEGEAPGWLRTGPPPWAGPGSQQEEPRSQQEEPGLGPSAHETTGSLLIAPGGRYRMRSTDEEGNTVVKGCDGDRPWLLCQPGEERPQKQGAETRLFGRPAPPSPGLLCPSWLLSGFELVLRETTTAGGGTSTGWWRRHGRKAGNRSSVPLARWTVSKRSSTRSLASWSAASRHPVARWSASPSCRR